MACLLLEGIRHRRYRQTVEVLARMQKTDSGFLSGDPVGRLSQQVVSAARGGAALEHYGHTTCFGVDRRRGSRMAGHLLRGGGGQYKLGTS